MTEETRKDVIWPIGFALSAALHVGGLFYLISHAKTPGATNVPTPAISVSLTPTKVFDAMNDAGAVEDAARSLTGEGGQEAQTTEQTALEKTQPDPEEEARLAADAEVRDRENAEAKAREKAETEARAKAEAEAREKSVAEAMAREKAEAEARAKAEQEVKALAEAREKAEAAERARAEQEAKAVAEAREKAEAEARAEAEAEKRERQEAEARAKARSEERERAEAEAREKAETERRLAEAKRRKEAEEEEAGERAEEQRERRAEAEKRKQLQTRRAGAAASGESETANRSQSGRLSASTGEFLNYKAKVQAHIARNKPRKNKRQPGVTWFQISLTESGTVISVHILRSSGDPSLDQATVTALRSAAPYPRAPANLPAKQRMFESRFEFQ
jgi:colicin import membrane protein